MNSNQDNSEAKLSDQLQRLLIGIEASGRAVLPGSNDALLNSIVEAAARIFGAAAASILLVNEEEQMLEFKVAYGPSDRNLVGTKFPLDRGIAGYVADSILATPLLSEDRIIGVMEILDKIDATSFGMQDMELLGMFAQQAAIAIDLSQQMENIEKALTRGLRRLVTADSSQDSTELLSILENPQINKGTVQDLLELADLFNEISALGDAERKACLQVLKVFAEYRRSTRRLR